MEIRDYAIRRRGISTDTNGRRLHNMPELQSNYATVYKILTSIIRSQLETEIK